MRQGDDSVVSGSVTGLVTKDIPVPRNMFGFYKFPIKSGEQGRLFRDGVFVRNLPPGLHKGWSLTHKYTVSLVDSRIHLIGDNTTDPNDRIEAYGMIAGPVGENQQPTPPCRVIVPLSMRIEVADIEILLNTVKPISTLRSMIINHTTLSIGQLHYDQLHHRWIVDLKDNLERYLQQKAVSSTGLKVLEVFVGEPKAASEEDNRRLKMFQLATDIKLQATRQQAQRQADVEVARTRKQEADLLGISPLLQELLKLPGGADIIKGDQELRKVAIAAGLLAGSGTTIIPINSSAPGDSSGNYIPPTPGSGMSGFMPVLPAGQTITADFPTTPPGSSVPFTAPGSSTFSSGPIQMPGTTSNTSQTTPPGDTQFNMERINRERSLFPAGEYDIREGVQISEDHAGLPARVYEFMLIARAGDPATKLSVTFDLVSDFPEQAPIVWVKWGIKAKSERYGGPAVRDWTDQNWLNEILMEIAQKPRL